MGAGEHLPQRVLRTGPGRDVRKAQLISTQPGWLQFALGERDAYWSLPLNIRHGRATRYVPDIQKRSRLCAETWMRRESELLFDVQVSEPILSRKKLRRGAAGGGGTFRRGDPPNEQRAEKDYVTSRRPDQTSRLSTHPSSIHPLPSQHRLQPRSKASSSRCCPDQVPAGAHSVPSSDKPCFRPNAEGSRLPLQDLSSTSPAMRRA